MLRLCSVYTCNGCEHRSVQPCNVICNKLIIVPKSIVFHPEIKLYEIIIRWTAKHLQWDPSVYPRLRVEFGQEFRTTFGFRVRSGRSNFRINRHICSLEQDYTKQTTSQLHSNVCFISWSDVGRQIFWPKVVPQCQAWGTHDKGRIRKAPRKFKSVRLRSGSDVKRHMLVRFGSCSATTHPASGPFQTIHSGDNTGSLENL